MRTVRRLFPSESVCLLEEHETGTKSLKRGLSLRPEICFEAFAWLNGARGQKAFMFASTIETGSDLGLSRNTIENQKKMIIVVLPPLLF